MNAIALRQLNHDEPDAPVFVSSGGREDEWLNLAVPGKEPRWLALSVDEARALVAVIAEWLGPPA